MRVVAFHLLSLPPTTPTLVSPLGHTRGRGYFRHSVGDVDTPRAPSSSAALRADGPAAAPLAVRRRRDASWDRMCGCACVKRTMSGVWCTHAHRARGAGRKSKENRDDDCRPVSLPHRPPLSANAGSTPSPGASPRPVGHTTSHTPSRACSTCRAPIPGGGWHNTHRRRRRRAGVGGLVAAALLARSGLDVTVLEAHDRPGGAAHSFKLGGAEFDAGPSFHAGLSPTTTVSLNPLAKPWPL